MTMCIEELETLVEEYLALYYFHDEYNTKRILLSFLQFLHLQKNWPLTSPAGEKHEDDIMKGSDPDYDDHN